MSESDIQIATRDFYGTTLYLCVHVYGKANNIIHWIPESELIMYALDSAIEEYKILKIPPSMMDFFRDNITKDIKFDYYNEWIERFDAKVESYKK